MDDKKKTYYEGKEEGRKEARAEIVAGLVAENTELRASVISMEADRREIYSIIQGIGGPLNDNKCKYTKKQLVPFFRIRELVE